jgi:hypothetical protein
MVHQKFFRGILGLGVSLLLFSAILSAMGNQAPGQAASAKRRTAPIYATGKDGAPAAGLTSADLEVKLSGNPIQDFTLTKGGSEHKLFFLVFDTASLSSNLLSKSKKIAASTVALAGSGVRFVVMSIDPGAGLRAICGPTTDKTLVTKAIGRSVTAKSGTYLQSRTTDGSSINDALPEGHGRSNLPSAAMVNEAKDADQRQDRQVGTIILTSLRTLNAVLSRFPESDKVVQLYSSGIPTGATSDRTTIQYGVTHGVETSGVSESENTSPDRTTYDLIKSSGQSIKQNGALFFAVDVGGTRIGESDAASGEQSLHMLVNESGGRFFKGSDKDIIDSLSAIEQGYYELSIPLLQEIQDAGLALEVHAKSPDITLSSTGAIARARRFAEMTPADKQSVILNILNNGLVGDIGVSVSPVQVEATGSDEETALTVQLPAGLSQAEWDIYKVWRDTGKGGFQVEKEHVLSESPMLTFSMAVKKNTLQDAVLVHAKSGTVLVCQGKQKPKS